MIVWSGRGAAILLFFNIFFWGIVFLSSLDESDNATAIIACFATAVCSLIAGRRWNAQTYESALRNQENPNEGIIPLSTFFWIRLENWFWILIVIGILIWIGVFG